MRGHRQQSGDPVWSKNPKHLLAQCVYHGAEGSALGSYTPVTAAAHAGLAAVAVNAVVLTWELAQMDILTMRVTTYTGSMAAGEKLSTKTANPKAWVLVMPQTDSETVF